MCISMVEGYLFKTVLLNPSGKVQQQWDTWPLSHIKPVDDIRIRRFHEKTKKLTSRRASMTLRRLAVNPECLVVGFMEIHRCCSNKAGHSR